jgi:hypothetical protein
MKRSDQKTVITPRLMAGNRAECVPANAIGHQPFACFRGV